MADYQEYRRRILHRRWRRVFIIVALLALVALLSAIGILWKVLHRERVDTALSQNTILRQVTTDNTWNYPLARQLRVQTLEGSTETALDFRMAALPASAPVEKSWFAQVSFVGDSLTQGMQIYDTGLPGAQFCAYKGVGPNAFVNGTSCKRADGVTEIPLDALTAGTAGGRHTGKPRGAEPGPPVPHQQRTCRHCTGKKLLFPEPLGGAGGRKRRPDRKLCPAGRLPHQAGGLRRMGRLPLQPHHGVKKNIKDAALADSAFCVLLGFFIRTNR